MCLITDDATISVMWERWGKLVDELFQYHVVDDQPDTDNQRMYIQDGERVPGTFWNLNRHTVFDLSPFDQTLVLDADYLVQSDVLNQVWTKDKYVKHRVPEFMINHAVASINDPMNIQTKMVSDTSIPMYWATAFWFRKTGNVKKFFQVVEYVRDNIAYYRQLYRFRGKFFRNDFAFSVAAHVMAAHTSEPWVKPLPESHLLFAWDDARLLDVRGDKLCFEGQTRDGRGKIPIITERRNVHCMNKKAVLQNALKLVGAD